MSEAEALTLRAAGLKTIDDAAEIKSWFSRRNLVSVLFVVPFVIYISFNVMISFIFLQYFVFGLVLLHYFGSIQFNYWVWRANRKMEDVVAHRFAIPLDGKVNRSWKPPFRLICGLAVLAITGLVTGLSYTTTGSFNGETAFGGLNPQDANAITPSSGRLALQMALERYQFLIGALTALAWFSLIADFLWTKSAKRQARRRAVQNQTTRAF